LGYSEVQSLLDETLAEEKNADGLLKQVAENYVNEATALKQNKITNSEFKGIAAKHSLFFLIKQFN
jgi:hypothetical protein